MQSKVKKDFTLIQEWGIILVGIGNSIFVNFEKEIYYVEIR
jgi:hypothetical protein